MLVDTRKKARGRSWGNTKFWFLASHNVRSNRLSHKLCLLSPVQRSSLLLREPHIIVQTPLRKKAIMCSLFCYLTVLQNDDEICFTRCEYGRAQPADAYLLERPSSTCHPSPVSITECIQIHSTCRCAMNMLVRRLSNKVELIFRIKSVSV